MVMRVAGKIAKKPTQHPGEEAQGDEQKVIIRRLVQVFKNLGLRLCEPKNRAEIGEGDRAQPVPTPRGGGLIHTYLKEIGIGPLNATLNTRRLKDG